MTTHTTFRMDGFHAVCEIKEGDTIKTFEAWNEVEEEAIRIAELSANNYLKK